MQMLRVELFVPQMPWQAYVRTRDTIVAEVGGLTEYGAIGHWLGEEQTYREGCVVMLFFMEHTEDNVLWVEEIAREYKEAAEQECVLYVLNGNDVIFIDD